MIKRAAIALEILLGLVWIVLFTQCLALLDQPSSLDVGLGALIMLGTMVVFPTVMRNVWQKASAHFKREKEENNEESDGAVCGCGCADADDGVRRNQN